MAQKQQNENQGELSGKRIAAGKKRDVQKFVQKAGDFYHLAFTARVRT